MATVASLLAALLVSAVQALLIHRRSIIRHVTTGPMVTRRWGVRGSNLLVVGQLALTLPLVVGAALLSQTLYRVTTADTGFVSTDLVQVEAFPTTFGYDPAQASAYYAALVEQLGEVPGVAAVTTSNGGALSGYGPRVPIQTETGQERVGVIIVGDGYFETMRVPVLAGRRLGGQDRPENTPVVMVSRAFARRLHPDETPAIGQILRLGPREWTIVGIAADTTFNDLRDGSAPAMYVPASQFPSSQQILHLRTEVDPAGLVEVIRTTALAVDPNVPLVEVFTIATRKHVATQRERLLAITSGAIGGLALLLSALGLYGSLAYAVVVRTREIGIRSALGAQRRHVAGGFVRETLLLLAMGCGLGLVAALALTRGIESQLFGVPAFDAATYIGAVGLLGLVSMLAIVWPVRQALRVHPVLALREE